MIRRVLLAIQSENCIGEIAHKCNAEINVVGCRDLDNESMMLALDISGSEGSARDVINYLKRLEGSRKMYCGERGNSGGICILILDKPALCKAALSSRVLCNTCPFNSKSMPLSWDVIVKDSNALKEMIGALDGEGTAVQVNSISEFVHKDILTNRQKEVLINAVALGYFEFPRKTDLKEFAQNLGIRPSTLSEILRSVQKKIVNHYLEEMKLSIINTKTGFSDMSRRN
jgi:hypothetical protein